MTTPVHIDSTGPGKKIPVYWHRSARIPWVSYFLIGINVVVFLIQKISLLSVGNDPLLAVGALLEERVLAGEVWRMLTYAFLHANLIHLAVNMYALYVLRFRELDYGHSRYLSLYLVSTLGGSVVWMLISSQVTIGAGAPLFGILGSEITLLLLNRRLIGNSTRYLTNILVTVAINLFLALTLKLNMFSILGGMLTGIVYGLFAGPLWRGAFEPSGIHILDQRAPERGLLVSGVLALIFCVIILFKMFI